MPLQSITSALQIRIREFPTALPRAVRGQPYNQPYQIETRTHPSAWVAYSYDGTATRVRLLFSAANLPKGMHVDRNTGAISGAVLSRGHVFAAGPCAGLTG